MRASPTVTVIIHAYNLELYIREAIESVLCQTCPPDQILVINDASTDSTASIVDSYAPLVEQVILSSNSGILTVTLEGIKRASSDIITFLDGDDIWHPSKLEKILDVYSSDPTTIFVTHNYICIDSKSRIVPHHADRTYQHMDTLWARYSDNPDCLSSKIKHSILSLKGIWLGSAWSFRRSSFDLDKFISLVSNFKFPDYISLTHQDQPLASFLVLSNLVRRPYCRFSYVNESLFSYRLHTNNTSGSLLSPSSARLSSKRALATISGLYMMLELHPYLTNDIEAQKKNLLRATAVYAIYNDSNIIKKIKTIIQLFKNLPIHHSLKEVCRLFVVEFIGMESFLLIKRLKSSLSNSLSLKITQSQP